MKYVVSVLLLFALPVIGQRAPMPMLDISVSNRVYFTVEKTTDGSVDMINFLVTVVNNGEEAIPDLRHDHVFQYSKIIVDGHPSSPFGFYNGPGSTRATNTLSKGESDSFGWGQMMTSKDAHPPVITVQWSYLGVKSDILTVDRVNKTVNSIGVKNLIAEQPPTEQWIYLGAGPSHLLRNETDKTEKSSDADQIIEEQAGPGYPPQGIGSADP